MADCLLRRASPTLAFHAIGTKEATSPQSIPRRDLWRDHFRLDGVHILPISVVGSITVRLLRLNAAERLAERKLLQSLGAYPVR